MRPELVSAWPAPEEEEEERWCGDPAIPSDWTPESGETFEVEFM